MNHLISMVMSSIQHVFHLQHFRNKQLVGDVQNLKAHQSQEINK